MNKRSIEKHNVYLFTTCVLVNLLVGNLVLLLHAENILSNLIVSYCAVLIHLFFLFKRYQNRRSKFKLALKGVIPLFVFAIVFASPSWILLSIWNFVCLIYVKPINR